LTWAAKALAIGSKARVVTGENKLGAFAAGQIDTGDLAMTASARTAGRSFLISGKACPDR